MKKIGVLGGMSPEATVEFYKELINQCRKQYGAQYDKDFPEIFIYNLPIPNIFENVDSPGNVTDILVKGIKKLEATGVDFIVMPCNTAHFFYEDMKKEVTIPFLSIMEETAKKIAELEFKKVGLLGTGTTVGRKLFNKDCKEQGIELILPSEQTRVTGIIDHILTGQKLGADKTELRQIIEKLKSRGAEAIILGCTDFRIVLKQSDINVKLIDTVEVLAESAVRFALK